MTTSQKVQFFVFVFALFSFAQPVFATVTYTRTPVDFYAGTTTTITLDSDDIEADYVASACAGGAAIMYVYVESTDFNSAGMQIALLQTTDPIQTHYDIPVFPNHQYDYVYYVDCAGGNHVLDEVTQNDALGTPQRLNLFNTWPLPAAATTTTDQLPLDSQATVWFGGLLLFFLCGLLVYKVVVGKNV